MSILKSLLGLTRAMETLHKAASHVKQEETPRNNISQAFGEITIDGIPYQMQATLVADKRCWLKEGEFQVSEVEGHREAEAHETFLKS